ncbi:methyl-CpG-binding domain-containing protein 7 isoform X1 [Primulina eburnea]|uniref:methyl-CpG-binding domain-containing protein 7 isoform X1 n=1 Tax=Primulina eburnea TaxID=1245227 RepID=UPI003C6C035E
MKRHTITPRPSNSMLVPLPTRRRMSVAPLPPGWGIKEVPRSDGYHSDMYYYEAETARKFRSMKEVERYLNGEEYTPRRSPRKMTLHNHMLRLDDGELKENHLEIEASTACKTPSVLPNGWIVKMVPRKYDTRIIDKYYYEPETRKMFRSLVSVERYLAELEENVPLLKVLEEIKENKPLSKFFKLQSRKKTSGNSSQGSSFVAPPMKVNWVLSSTKGDAWSPFVSDTLVPDSVRQQWTDRFVELMNEGTSLVPSSNHRGKLLMVRGIQSQQMCNSDACTVSLLFF